MKKSKYIERYGEAAYEKKLEQTRAWQDEHREEENTRRKKYRKEHQDREKAHHREQSRKGGKHYDKTLEYNRTGLSGDRKKIRMKHGNQYRPYKQIIAPDSQIHHEWLPDTAEYRGLALVEANAHQYGIIDVIQILDGEITQLTEEQIRKGCDDRDEQ